MSQIDSAVSFVCQQGCRQASGDKKAIASYRMVHSFQRNNYLYSYNPKRAFNYMYQARTAAYQLG